MLTYTATEFKARCLAILDEVNATGEAVSITKRGRPVARVLPAARPAEGYPQDKLRGTGKILGDIVGSICPEEEWDACRE